VFRQCKKLRLPLLLLLLLSLLQLLLLLQLFRRLLNRFPTFVQFYCLTFAAVCFCCPFLL